MSKKIKIEDEAILAKMEEVTSLVKEAKTCLRRLKKLQKITEGKKMEVLSEVQLTYNLPDDDEDWRIDSENKILELNYTEGRDEADLPDDMPDFLKKIIGKLIKGDDDE